MVGACATLIHRHGHNDALRVWAKQLLDRKTVKFKFKFKFKFEFKLTALALANKVARTVFALLTKGGEYNEMPARAAAA